MLTGCEDELCDLVTTLNDELQLTTPHTSKETALIDDLLIQLDDSTTCLLAVYNGSMFNGTENEIVVGADTYFNVVKPCYVRTISTLGAGEQILIDGPNASFLVQKLQALEVDYQRMLHIEDLKASRAFSVPHATLTGTVEGAAQQQPLGIPDFALTHVSESFGGGVSTFTVQYDEPTSTTGMTTLPSKIIVMLAGVPSDVCMYSPANPAISAPAGVVISQLEQEITGLGSICAATISIREEIVIPFNIVITYSTVAVIQNGILAGVTIPNTAPDNDWVAGGSVGGVSQITFDAGADVLTEGTGNIGLPVGSITFGVPTIGYNPSGGPIGTIATALVVHQTGDILTPLSADATLFPLISLGPAISISLPNVDASFWYTNGQHADTGPLTIATVTTLDTEILTGFNVRELQYPGGNVNDNSIIADSGEQLPLMSGAVALDFTSDKSGVLVLGIAAFLVAAIFLFILTKKQQ